MQPLKAAVNNEIFAVRLSLRKINNVRGLGHFRLTGVNKPERRASSIRRPPLTVLTLHFSASNFE